DNLVVRLAAANQLDDRIGKDAIGPLTDLVAKQNVSSRAYIHGLWVLHRLTALSSDLISKSAEHNDPIIRLHTMRILREKELDDSFFGLVSKSLEDTDPHVKRAATELLVKFPNMA